MRSRIKRIDTVRYLLLRARLTSSIYFFWILPKRPDSSLSLSESIEFSSQELLWHSFANMFKNAGIMNIAMIHDAVREIITTIGINFMNFPIRPVSIMSGVKAAEIHKKVTVTGHISSAVPLTIASVLL
ncbi:MAG: hypothetical protein BWY23_02171 [Spirochaetes bacterium ADurb.Bin218]|nr:MAG: hypothetical protein BWY23_02171 [Spirochaetes bacterium ADurb.Bin218]